jgi:hypothetical protein
VERGCNRCGWPAEPEFRFCPWCAAPLRLKLTELFAGEDGRALRASRYLAPAGREPYVRLSVWSPDGECEAAVSVDEAEAARLVGFLSDPDPPRRRRKLRDALGPLARPR